MPAKQDQFLKLARQPARFGAFLLWKLPSAYFSGVRVRSLDPGDAVTTVPYKWFSQNPFRSTYFACLAMAAEMSTGLLGMLHSYKSDPPVSMLVTAIEGSFIKKASGLTIFTCTDGALIRAAIETTLNTGEPRIVRARSLGTNHAGETVAEFFITWSFKRRQ